MQWTKFYFIVFLGLLHLFIGCQPRMYVLQSNELLNAVLWMQRSAEYKASTIQAFKVAQRMFTQALQDNNWSAALEQSDNFQNLPIAVIIDIDETVLDNSPYEASLIKTNKSYTEESWIAWCNEARASAVPGALEFCQLVAAKGATIFYVTNRADQLREVTRKNLMQLGFPLAKNIETILTKTDTSDKGPRRREIALNYRIVLQIGDNNSDFASEFTKNSETKRDYLVTQFKDYWGTKWIVLSNPVYGDWEGAIINYNFSLDVEKILRLKYEALR